MRSAFVDIVRNRGFQGLYSGLSPTLVEIIPYAGLQFGTYDTFKRWTMVKFQSLYLTYHLFEVEVLGVIWLLQNNCMVLLSILFFLVLYHHSTISIDVK